MGAGTVPRRRAARHPPADRPRRPADGGPHPGLGSQPYDQAALECFTAERDIIRHHTPQVPVPTNFTASFQHLDCRRWAAEEDVATIDVYPDSSDPEGQLLAACNFDLMRSLRGGRPWLLPESATGANVPRRRNSARPAGQLRVRSLQAPARGSDSVMCFQWRQSRAGAERFRSAMLPHGGTRTRTWREVTELGRDLRTLAGLAGGRAETAEVAVVWDWDNWWALEGPNHPSAGLAFQGRGLDHYRPLWGANLPVDFLHPHHDLGAYPGPRPLSPRSATAPAFAPPPGSWRRTVAAERATRAPPTPRARRRPAVPVTSARRHAGSG
ncbi:beta-galactosidase [Streptomyces hoynatensis]|uniref:beta-galactosidase n=1 Tax=Streptomyces hoynatensis TaxID=1141874 RepID=UPI00240E2389|nr:beta-galactosidase [Streptomyces hoynatensis]